jgi:hypothetical protein
VGFSPRALAVTSYLFGPDRGRMVQEAIIPKQTEIKIILLIVIIIILTAIASRGQYYFYKLDSSLKLIKN